MCRRIGRHVSASNGRAIVTGANGRILERIDEDTCSPLVLHVWLMPTIIFSCSIIEQTPDIPENLGVSETAEYQIQMLDYKPAHFIFRTI